MKGLKIAARAAVILILLVTTVVLLYFAEKSGRIAGIASDGSSSETMTYKKGVDISAADIEYNGQHYRYNDHLTNFLFLGIDKRELVDTQKGQADAGQSDAIFVLSMDRMSGETTMISIPRDTMTYITGITEETQEPVLIYDHISVQYGYGDGKHESCNLTKDSVSSILYSLPIQGYCAIALDALGVLADEMNGIKVTVPNDSLYFKDDRFTPGSVVSLNKNNIETFLRVRDINTTDSALYRLDRQKVFLKAFLEQVRSGYDGDQEMVTRMYDEIHPYMVTNMGNDQFVKLMKGVNAKDEVAEWTLPGEGVQTETYDEYHVNEDELLKKLLDTVCILR